jgi:hypothetical protein
VQQRRHGRDRGGGPRRTGGVSTCSGAAAVPTRTAMAPPAAAASAASAATPAAAEAAPTRAAPAAAARAATPAAAKLRINNDTVMWASRLDVTPDNLVHTSRAVVGIDIARVTPSQREVIGGDFHRAIAQVRHAPAHPTAQRSLALRSAEGFILDGFRPIALASPLDGAVYSLHAVCEFSSFFYIMTVRSHGFNDWLTFIRCIIYDAKSYGHKPL